MVAPQVHAAKRLLRKVCGYDTKEVVTIVVSFSPKNKDTLPALQVKVSDLCAGEKMSFDSCSKTCSEESEESIGTVGGGSIPLIMHMDPEDGFAREGTDVVISFEVPDQYKDRINTRITTVTRKVSKDEELITPRPPPFQVFPEEPPKRKSFITSLLHFCLH